MDLFGVFVFLFGFGGVGGWLDVFVCLVGLHFFGNLFVYVFYCLCGFCVFCGLRSISIYSYCLRCFTVLWVSLVCFSLHRLFYCSFFDSSSWA